MRNAFNKGAILAKGFAAQIGNTAHLSLLQRKWFSAVKQALLGRGPRKPKKPVLPLDPNGF